MKHTNKIGIIVKCIAYILSGIWFGFELIIILSMYDTSVIMMNSRREINFNNEADKE